MRGHRSGLELVLATLFYFAFACFITWPMITDLGRIYYGAAGDPFGAMSFYRELVDHHHNPFLPGTLSQLAAPEGQPIPWTRDLAAAPSVLTMLGLTAGFGQISALDLYALLGFTLSGTAMFAFVRRLTLNPWAALICGWALAFYPFAVINGQGHDDYIHSWVLVLAVWRMIELHWRPNRRNAVLAGLAVALSMWWTPYFILLGGVTYAAALVASLLLAWRGRGLRAALPAQAITAAIVVVFLGLLASLATGASGNSLGLRTNSLAEFNTYSARPLEYVLPDAQSPVFGRFTAQYLTAHIHGSNLVESTLYVGVTVILLAIGAGIAMLRRRLPPRTRGPVVILWFIAVAALITSAPPEAHILGLNVPFPSHFIMKVTTTWRVYSRFVIVVMLALGALAGIGLAALTRGRRRYVRIAVMLVASVLIPLDLWGRLVGRTNTNAVPAVYTALSHMPRGLTADYPLTPNGENQYNDVFYQNVYDMPLINGYGAGTVQERRALTLTNLAQPQTAERLAALGVRWVILESTPPGYGLTPPGTPRRGFRAVYHSTWGSLYEVTARPAGPALATPGDGFADDEVAPNGSVFNWLEHPHGTIELAGTCIGCRGVLELTLTSLARPRIVTIRADRRTVFTGRIFSPTRVDIPVTYGPVRALMITATPGPESIQKATGSPDPRSVSVQVSNLSFVWPKRRSGSR